MTTRPVREATLIALLHRASRALVDDLTARMNAAGYPDIQTSHHAVFENIDADGSSITRLAARAGVTHQSMGQVIERLEDLGYVERVADPNDRRARLVRLTPAGRAVARRALTEIGALTRDWTRRCRA